MRGSKKTAGRLYRCGECPGVGASPETCSDRRLFARHLYAHTFLRKTAEEMAHVCSDCDAHFSSKRETTVHLRKSKK